MNTLYKTIKRQWFEMIVSGDKKEEYLEIKEHWIKRLLIDVEVHIHSDITNFQSLVRNIKEQNGMVSFGFEEFDTVTCRNGYSTTSPLVIWEHKGIRIGEGNPDWGAVPGVVYFCLQIGEIISVKNI